MFLGIEKRNPESIAAIKPSGVSITYGGLMDFTKGFGTLAKPRSLLSILTENSIGSLAAYVGALSNGIAPLLVGTAIDRSLLDGLIQIYYPAYLWVPRKISGDFTFSRLAERFEYVLFQSGL